MVLGKCCFSEWYINTCLFGHRDRDHECYFSADHAAKDSGIAISVAEEAGINVPLAKATLAQYQKMVELGLGELDKSGIAELTFKGRGEKN